MDSITKVYVEVGESVHKRMPWSEVMMHMNMADKMSIVRITESGMAQLLDSSGRNYSFPVTLGEAGLYTDAYGIYYIPELD